MLLIFNLKFKSSADYFLTVFFFLCILNSNIFYSVSGITNLNLTLLKNFIFLIFFLTVIFSIKLTSKINFLITKNLIGIVRIRVELIITILLIIVFIFVNLNLSISFENLGNYESRIEGRNLKQISFLSYFWNGGLNGLAPILSFLSIYNKRYFYFFFAIFFSLAGYTLIGVKLSFILVIFMAYLGWFFSYRKNNFLEHCCLIFVLLSLVCFFEYLFFNYSFVGEYIIRRIFLTLSQNQMYYIDFIAQNLLNLDNKLFGLTFEKSESYYLGNLYYNNEFSNANSNTFFSEIIRGGFFGYLINLIFIIFFLSFSNYCYKITNHHVWYAIPILYAFLISEQNYKTAFLSSGVLFIIILLFIFKNENYKNYKFL
jgi:hypothetical protein